MDLILMIILNNSKISEKLLYFFNSIFSKDGFTLII